MSGLPDGWTIERIRGLGVRQVALLAIDTYVVEDRVDNLIELAPAVIIDCGGLCLVQDQTDDEWHMGSADDDGTIVCWGSYGDDLSVAIEAL